MPSDHIRPSGSAPPVPANDAPNKPATDAAGADPDATVFSSAGSGATLLPPSPQAAIGAKFTSADGNLPPGYRLEQFEVHEQVGFGGFSVVYKVFDNRLDQYRALKEYFPRGFAVRVEGLRVEPRSTRDKEVFGIGLEHFVGEGKTLAKFDHPSLVHVYQTIEANGTAYMVMNLIQGDTLEKVVAAMASPPNEAWLLKLLDPLTAALAVVHHADIFHRDIKPANVVLVPGSQRPVLLDFGAARQVIDKSVQLTGILTHGYAPIEQYDGSGMQQGAWTDIYALAASVHWMITGEVPPNANTRQVKDRYLPLSKRLAGQYSDRLLKTLDACLAVDPTKRPQSIDDLRSRLDLQASAFGLDNVTPKVTAKRKFGPGSPVVWAAAGAVALVVAGGVAFVAISGSGSQTPPPKAASSPAPPLVPVDPPTPVGPADVPPSASQPGTQPSAPQVFTATPAPPSTAPLPTEPAAAFDHIISGSSSDFGVRLEIEKTRLIAGVTPFRLRLTSAKAGHYYVLIHDTDGEVRVLFPDAWHPESRISAAQTLHWPAKGEEVKFGEPLGKARILVVVSEVPLDFKAATKRMDQDWRLLFKSDEVKGATAGQPIGRHLYLGLPKCTSGINCEAPYGAAAAVFEVVE